MIQHQRNINMYPGVRAPERIHLSQYDSDFTLVFSLYSSAGSFSVESGTTAMVRGTKGDGNGYSASASLSGTTVTVQGNNQMTAVAGPNTYELVLTRSGKVLSTANFILDVEPAAMDANTIQSDTVLMELQAIIDSASVSTAAADRAEEAAEEAEGHANGTVRFDIDQSLTSPQKAQARENIGIDEALDYQLLPDGADLNNYYETGRYYVGGPNRQIDNFPTSAVTACLIDVTHLSNGLTSQVATLIGNGNIFARWRFNNGTWGAWKSVTLDDNAKKALISCFEHIALWTDGNGNEYIYDLCDAIGAEYSPDHLEYPSNIMTAINGTTQRISSSDTRCVIKTTSPRKIVGSSKNPIKIMDTGLETLNISPIRIPEGSTGVTVTFEIAESLNDVAYTFTRLSKASGYYNLTTWTAASGSGVRTALSNSSEELLLTIYSTGGSPITLNSVRIDFDKQSNS